MGWGWGIIEEWRGRMENRVIETEGRTWPISATCFFGRRGDLLERASSPGTPCSTHPDPQRSSSKALAFPDRLGLHPRSVL